MRLFSKPLLSAIFASGMAGYLLAIFMAYLGLHAENLGAAAFVIGVIFFSRNFFQIFLRVPFGELAQIIGRKPLITAGTSCYVFAFGLMYLAQSWVLVFVATFFIAVGMALYWPAMFSYIGDISKDDYGKINGYIFQGSDIGVIIGTFLAGYLLRNEIVNLNQLFGIGMLIGLVGTVIIHLTLVEVLDPEEQLQVDSVFAAMLNAFRESFNGLIKMSKQPKLGIIYLFQFVISFMEFFFNSFFPLLIVFYLGFMQSQVSDIIFYTTIVIFFFKPYLGTISDKFGFRYPVLISLTITAISLAALTMVSDIIWVIIIYGIVVSSSLTSYLAVNGATSYTANNSMRGLAMGALGFWVSFGRSSSSLVLTPLWSWYELTTNNQGIAVRNVFLITAGIILVSVLVLFYLSRDLEISSSNKKSEKLSQG